MQELGLLERLIVSVFNFFSYMIDLIPSFELGSTQRGVSSFFSSLSASIDFMSDLIAGAGILIPVVDVFIIISIVVGFRVFMFTVFIINWVIRRIADVIP
ncbi:hypothetical protein QBE52_18955 [Clostridiaceae bacterium 35-E11]